MMSDANLAIKELINNLDNDVNRRARLIEALKGLLERLESLEDKVNSLEHTNVSDRTDLPEWQR